MKLRILLALLIALCVLPGLAMATVIALAAIRAAPDARLGESINPLLSLAFAGIILAALGAWFAASRYLLSPLAALTREAKRLSLTAGERALSIPRDAAIKELSHAVSAVGGALRQTNETTQERVRAATQTVEAQKRRLEAILLDLTEGVIVCNRDHRIILYNESARRILGLREMTGLGRSLFGVLAREPVLHTLDMLTRGDSHAKKAGCRFTVATVDLGTLIETRMSLIREASGESAVARSDGGVATADCQPFGSNRDIHRGGRSIGDRAGRLRGNSAQGNKPAWVTLQGCSVARGAVGPGPLGLS